MSQLIVLVRHGRSQANFRKILADYRDRYPLTPLGVTQARTAAVELAKLRIEALFSSPVLRARQTAGIIGRRLGLDVSLDVRLWERRFGRLAGTYHKKGMWRFTKAKFESFESVHKRIMSFINSNKDIPCYAAVTHMDTIANVLMKRWGQDEMSGFVIRPYEGTITLLERDGPKIRVLASGIPYLSEGVMERIPKKYRVEV